MDDFKIQGDVGGYTTDQNEAFAPNHEGAALPWEPADSECTPQPQGFKGTKYTVNYRDPTAPGSPLV